MESASGENATFDVFADQIGIDVTDGVLGLPDAEDYFGIEAATNGEVYTDGDECPGGPGRVALFVWGPDAPEGSAPEIVTENIGSARFSEDGQRFVLAFTPEGVVPPQPPSTPTLAAPSDMESPG